MGFLDSAINSFKNSGNIENAFDTAKGGLFDKIGSSVGDFLGDAVDAVQNVAKPLFATKEEANTELMSINPTPLVDDEPESIGYDERTHNAYPTMTHIRNWVRAELIRREGNVGLNYTNDSFGEEASQNILNSYVLKNGQKETGLHIEKFFRQEQTIRESYRGPKSSWCRVTSNGIALNQDGKKREGFILHGVDNFNENYGFGSAGNHSTPPNILGYDVLGEQHYLIEPDFKHRPAPGITDIESEDMGVATNHKKTTIKFVAWSRSQVDYLDPYFFQPGNTICVEWGWNFFPKDVLLAQDEVGRPPRFKKGKDLSSDEKNKVNSIRQSDPDYIMPNISNFNDEQEYMYEEGSGLVNLWNNSLAVKRQLKKGRGNYSFVLGMISNFNYSLRDDGGYDCSVEITSVSYLMSQLENSASSSAGTDEETEGEVVSDDKNIIDLFKYVDTYLLETIEEQDENPDDHFLGIGNPLADFTSSYNTYTNNMFGLLKGNGRYFSFGYSGKWDINVDDNKQYMANSTDDGKYITFGWLIDIFNAYFARESEDTNATVFKFDVTNSRCVAHPNIKSLDGNVLLIPNAMSPRTNTKNFKNSTIGIAGFDDSSQPLNKSVIYNKFTDSDKEKKYSQARNAFIGAVKSESGIANIRTLEEALEKSPRDDLHRLMTLHRHWSHERDFPIRPFPDYEDLDEDNGISSEGYSGIIQDVYVNYEVIKDAVKSDFTAHAMLKTILQKMSNASGGIWDFDLVGDDPNDSSNCVTKIIDRKFTSNNIYDIQKKKKAFIFHAHKKNSIVRSMNTDVSITGDIAGQVLFSNPTDPDSAFYARGQSDRILKRARISSKDAGTLSADKEKKETEIADASKFIVGIEVDIDENVKTLEGVSINDENQFNASVFDDNRNTFSDTYVVDVEFVEPNQGRAQRRTTKDKNPKNCIKYNMPLDTIELSLELDGIEGIRLWDMFNCTGVPTKYYMNGLWRVTNIKHSLSNNDWSTSLTAQFCPNAVDTNSRENE
jgi:hypothetical protein